MQPAVAQPAVKPAGAAAASAASVAGSAPDPRQALKALLLAVLAACRDSHEGVVGLYDRQVSKLIVPDYGRWVAECVVNHTLAGMRCRCEGPLDRGTWPGCSPAPPGLAIDR